MTNALPPDDPLKGVWLSQPVELTQMTATDLTTASSGFERKVRRRNYIEYVAGAFAAAAFAYMGLFTRQNWITRTGDVVIILGVAFMLWQLHRRGSPGRTPAGGAVESLLMFQRTELARQRDALKAVPVWYLLPAVPGFIVLGLGSMQDRARHMAFQQNLAIAITAWVIIALVLTIVWLLNAWVAARLDRAIDRIDTLRRE
jgi:hypothetical protein